MEVSSAEERKKKNKKGNLGEFAPFISLDSDTEKSKNGPLRIIIIIIKIC